MIIRQLSIYKNLYEDALTKLNKSNSIVLSSKNLNSKDINPDKVNQIITKVKTFINENNEKESSLEFESQEETMIFCETLKMMYLKEKSKINEKIDEVNSRLKQLDQLKIEYDNISSEPDDRSEEEESNNNIEILKNNLFVDEKPFQKFLNPDKSNSNKEKKNLKDFFLSKEEQGIGLFDSSAFLDRSKTDSSRHYKS